MPCPGGGALALLISGGGALTGTCVKWHHPAIRMVARNAHLHSVVAEPVASTVMASSALPGDPVIVWYGTANHSGWENPEPVILRAWSDGTIEGMKVQGNYQCQDLSVCGGGWTVLSSPQMACRTDIDGNGAVELGDLLAVLSQWGQEASCPNVVQLQCGLMHLR